MEVDSKEVITKWYEANLQTLRELGLYAIKTLVTLNSGSIVVMLTFIGNAAAQTRYSLELNAIKLALYSFLFGITCSAIVVAVAYINSMRMSPYETKKGMGDTTALFIYVGFSILAFLAFVCGVVSVISGVVEL